MKVQDEGAPGVLDNTSQTWYSVNHHQRGENSWDLGNSPASQQTYSKHCLADNLEDICVVRVPFKLQLEDQPPGDASEYNATSKSGPGTSGLQC